MGAVEAYVGIEGCVVTVKDGGDLFEVLDHVHTLVIDASGISEEFRKEAIHRIEELMEWVSAQPEAWIR